MHASISLVNNVQQTLVILSFLCFWVFLFLKILRLFIPLAT